MGRSASFTPPVVLLCLAPLLGQQAGFSEQTLAAGMYFAHRPTDDHSADIMHGSGAVGDFNRDGWPDVFVIGGGDGDDALFINQGDGTFVDEAVAWGLAPHLHRGVGAVAADYDADGWEDLFVTSFGPTSQNQNPGRHLLYHNTGTGSFEEVAGAAGVAWSAPGIADGFGSAFGDIDQDGDLDLFVSGWMSYAEGNRMFRNEGDGTFVDVTRESGLFDRDVRAFSPRFADFDGDRSIDLALVADYQTSRFYVNRGHGRFENVTQTSNFASESNGMGAALGDFDRDGRVDLYVTSIYWDPPIIGVPNGNRMYWNAGLGGFEVGARTTHAVDGGWGWGTVGIDCDHDGWLDLIEVNGWDHTPEFRSERAYLYHNLHEREFQEAAPAFGFLTWGEGRGVLRLDYDRDGDMDFVALRYAEELQLFRNDLDKPDSHWLQIELDTSGHPGLAPQGIGATILVGSAGDKQAWSVDAGPNYLGNSERLAHFGLGGDAVVDEVRVQWPDGFDTVLADVPADQRIVIRAQPPFDHDALVRGTRPEFRLRGAHPGESVLFLGSTAGAGRGRCLPELGGLCLGILPPVEVLASARVDLGGLASATVAVPARAPLVPLATQAVVLRAGRSRASNVRTAVIEP